MSINKNFNKLLSLLQEGPILPGGIRESLGTCGKPICRCKRKKEPQLHGPYNTLSFSLKEKSSSVSLSPKDALLGKEMVERFKEAKSLLNELAIGYVDMSRKDGIAILTAPELEQKKKRGKSNAEIKKSKEQSQKNAINRLKIKNMSRDLKNSKAKCNRLKEEKQALEVEINLLKKELKKQTMIAGQLEKKTTKF